MTRATAPTFDEIWPFRQVAVPSELSGVQVDRFLSSLNANSTRSTRVTEVATVQAAPTASYAMQVAGKGGRLSGAVWSVVSDRWVNVFECATPNALDGRVFVIEFTGVLLGNVATPNELSFRIRLLLQKELNFMGAVRLFARLIAVFAIMTLFYAIRTGVEASAIEPFVIIFAAAFSVAMAAVYLRQKGRSMLNNSMTQLQEQFLFEYDVSRHSDLNISQVSDVMVGIDRSQEERAVVFGFCLLLSFVYFISPLIVIGALVALFLGILTLGSGNLRLHYISARNRSEKRLENAMLSYRAGNDQFSPIRLRRAKKDVLRDRLKRFEKVSAELSRHDVGAVMRVDIAHAFALLAIVGAYALPLAAGIEQSASNLANSFETVSLFSVAPVIVLISISKSTVATAKVVSRKLAEMLKSAG